MTRKLFISLLIIIVLAAGAFALACSRTSQMSLVTDNDSGRLCTVPVSGSPLIVEVAPGLQFKLDTGSDVSVITREGLAKLDSLGFHYKESFYPVTGRDGKGDMRLELSRYTVDIPMGTYTFEIDSLGHVIHNKTPERINVFHNVDFILSQSGYSVLGIDFLEKFKVEYSYQEHSLSLYHNIPEGYQKITGIETSSSPLHMPWLGNRYYINIKAERKRDSYFIDTGIRNARIKLPAKERVRSSRHLSDTIVVSARGEFSGAIDRNAWIIFGDRAGTYEVCYYDNDEEEYAINPLNLFDQDIILDFNGGALWMRPYSMTNHNKHINALSSIRGAFTPQQAEALPEMEAWLNDTAAENNNAKNN